MSKDWLWNKWEETKDDNDIGGPIETKHYNGFHGLKGGIVDLFQTVLQCVF